MHRHKKGDAGCGAADQQLLDFLRADPPQNVHKLLQFIQSLNNIGEIQAAVPYLKTVQKLLIQKCSDIIDHDLLERMITGIDQHVLALAASIGPNEQHLVSDDPTVADEYIVEDPTEDPDYEDQDGEDIDGYGSD